MNDKKIAFAFGCVFLLTLLILAIRFPQPTHFQYLVFRVVMALAAAGAGAMIPGFLTVTLKPANKILIRAGGALAVFVIVYFFDPASRIIEKEKPSEKTILNSGQMAVGNSNTLLTANVSNPVYSPVLQVNQSSNVTQYNDFSTKVGGDLLLVGKRIIESITITSVLESQTSSNAVTEMESSLGVGVNLAAVADDKTEIVFRSLDRDAQFQQVTPNKRIMVCVFRPEKPREILGKDIDFLNTIHSIGVRYPDHEEVKSWPKDERRRLSFSIMLNGLEVISTPTNDIPSAWDWRDGRATWWFKTEIFEGAARNYKRDILAKTFPSK